MFGTPVGYAWHADTYCPECMVAIAAEHGFDPNDYEQSVEHECAPMFETTETDTPNHCGVCMELLDTQLTDHGVRYVISALWEHIHKAEKYLGRPEIISIISRWRDHIRFYGGLSKFQEGVLIKHCNMFG